MSDALLRHAAHSIKVGSRSFNSAAQLLPPQARRGAMMLYAWCRHCDDMIDGQTAGLQGTGLPQAQARAQLAALRVQTAAAYAGHAPTHPAFEAFQEVIRRFEIPQVYAMAHLAGYEMDVEGHAYLTWEDTLTYCYRVAGVVGLMMAPILGVRQAEALDRACDLGLAFQLTNIARDLVEDAAIGRCYVPLDWLREEGVDPARIGAAEHRPALARIAVRLVDAAEPYYDSARIGLAALPLRTAWAIATAHGVYREIGVKVRARGAAAWDERVRTSTFEKFTILSGAGPRALQSRWQPVGRRADSLWSRPGIGPDG